MRRIILASLFGPFMGLIAYGSAARLYEWCETGHLVMHRKMPIGSDSVTYSDDPFRFLMEFDLDLFLIAIGALGVLAACREVILAIGGPHSYLLALAGWHHASNMISIFLRLAGGFFLVVLALIILHRAIA